MEAGLPTPRLPCETANPEQVFLNWEYFIASRPRHPDAEEGVPGSLASLASSRLLNGVYEAEMRGDAG